MVAVTKRDFDSLKDTLDRWRVRIQNNLDKHEKTLYGNDGQPGMDEQIRNIWQWIEDQKKASVARRQWWDKLQWVLIPVFVGLVITFIGQAIYFYVDIVPKLQALP